jgi:hypothetical protein
MSVLIKGMNELPEEGDVLTVKHDDDGKVYIKYAGMMGYSMQLVKLPVSHGDLIDRDALEPDIFHDWNGYKVPNDDYSYKCIRNAPVVLEAEKEDTDE